MLARRRGCVVGYPRMKISTIYRNVKKGFTLIELLVVIAILATLAAVGYPVIMSQMDSARVSQAGDMCVKIVNAVEGFMTDNNGNYPFEAPSGKGKKSSGATDLGDENYLLITSEGRDGSLVRVLAAQEEDTNLNRAAQPYITTTLAENKGEAGLYQNTENGELEMYDPWGNPYYVVICPDKRGAYDPFTATRVIGKRCLAFSLGQDGLGEPDVTSLKASLGKKGGKKGKRNVSTATDDDDDNPLADNIYSWKKTKKD